MTSNKLSEVHLFWLFIFGRIKNELYLTDIGYKWVTLSHKTNRRLKSQARIKQVD